MTTCQVFRGRTLTEARRAAVQALEAAAPCSDHARGPPCRAFADLSGSTEVEVVATAPTPSTPPSTPSRRANPSSRSAPTARGAAALRAAADHALTSSSSSSSSAVAGPSVAALVQRARSELRAQGPRWPPRRVPPALMVAELAALRTASRGGPPRPHGDRAVASPARPRHRGPRGHLALARAARHRGRGRAARPPARGARRHDPRGAWPLAGDGRALVASSAPPASARPPPSPSSPPAPASSAARSRSSRATASASARSTNSTATPR